MYSTITKPGMSEVMCTNGVIKKVGYREATKKSDRGDLLGAIILWIADDTSYVDVDWMTEKSEDVSKSLSLGESE